MPVQAWVSTKFNSNLALPPSAGSANPARGMWWRNAAQAALAPTSRKLASFWKAEHGKRRKFDGNTRRQSDTGKWRHVVGFSPIDRA